MILKELNNKKPKYGENCFFAENSVLIGAVEMGDNCSIWYNAVLRGDVNYIKLGNKVNVQDGAVIHGTYKKHPTNIGNNVSVAHNATVHGCTIHDNVLIGMNAVILDEVVINSNSIVAAAAGMSPPIRYRIRPPAITGKIKTEVKMDWLQPVPNTSTAANMVSDKSWINPKRRMRRVLFCSSATEPME